MGGSCPPDPLLGCRPEAGGEGWTGRQEGHSGAGGRWWLALPAWWLALPAWWLALPARWLALAAPVVAGIRTAQFDLYRIC